jgi:hypothetical protein
VPDQIAGDGNDPGFNDLNKAAFASASDTCKTLLTLTTGILALTISFMGNVAKGATPDELWILRASWLLFLVSAIFGVLTLQGFTGSLAPMKKPKEGEASVANVTPSIYQENIAKPAIKQNLSFGIGVLLFIVFGLLSVSVPKTPPTVQVVCAKNSSICQVTK